MHEQQLRDRFCGDLGDETMDDRLHFIRQWLQWSELLLHVHCICDSKYLDRAR
jgi:hypothetical protein